MTVLALFTVAWPRTSLAQTTQNAPDQDGIHLHAAPKPLPAGAVTADWDAFLGSQGNGQCRETKLLKRFPSAGPTLLWEVRKGTGFSSPAIGNGRVILFHRLGNTESVDCLNALTGRRLWRFSYPTTYKDRYGFNNGPRSSPVIDNGRVYTYGVEAKLHCLNLETGQLLWSRDLRSDFQVPPNYFGEGTSPRIWGDVLILNVGGQGGPAVIGLDKTDGHTVWQTDNQDWGASYASPVVGKVHGQPLAFVLAGGDVDPPTGGLLGIDLNKGAVRYRFAFRSKNYISVNAASPVLIDDRVFLSSSYRTGGVMLALESGGHVRQLWKTGELECHFATPIYREGHLYGFDGSGKSDTSLVCLEASTGKLKWRHVPEWTETLDVGGKPKDMSIGVMRGSLIWADGRFLCLGEMGHLLWLNLTPQGYEQIARARLFWADETWTPPAISQGLLYIMQNQSSPLDKSVRRLLCYDLRAAR